MALTKRLACVFAWVSVLLLQRYVQSKKINPNHSVTKLKSQKQTSNLLTNVSDNGTPSPFATIFPVAERKIGTKLTGTGSRRNKSILMIKKDVKRKKNKKKKLQITSKLYAKVSTDGTLLFYFPNENNSNEPTARRNEIVSLTAEIGDQYQKNEGSVLMAKFVPKEEKIFDFNCIDEWVPLDGIFGIYELPSGPHLVLIVDSEEIYNTPPSCNQCSNNPLLQIRRIKSMEIIPLQLFGKDGQIIEKKDNEDEQRQFQRLRDSFKEHDFYFLSPLKDSIVSAQNNIVVPDITHTLQRSFLYWKDKELENTFEPDTMERDSSDISIQDEDVEKEEIAHESITAEHKGDETDTFNTVQKPTNWWWSLISEETKYQRPDSRFFWNEYATEPLLKAFNTSTSPEPYTKLLDHIIPVTSAFVGVQKDISIFPNSTSAVKNLQYDQLLISRRSKYRAGTRFTKRGADASGDVANYVETEQICILHDDRDNNYTLKEVYAHVQTRGSIPIRWSSPTDIKTYRPKVMIGTDPLAQARALRNHLFEQLSLYSSQTNKKVKLDFVNLIDKHSDQGRLGRTFAAILDAVLSAYSTNDKSPNPQLIKSDSVRHIWFDFHAECKSGRWDRLNNLLKEVRQTLDDQRYFCVVPDGTVWDIVSTQDGVVRTNCMDCLDRTNVVQSMFGRYMIYQHFNDRLGVVSSEPKGSVKRFLPLDFTVAFKRNMMSLPWKEGEEKHRLLWADNADAISRLYAGTPALKGDFTRTGKRTRRGALDDGMNSLQRFYLNNFIDADRQEGMDLLTGYSIFDTTDTKNEMSKQEDNVRNNIHSPLKTRYLKRLMEREKLQKELEMDSRLSLYWLPGDLQSHLRSAAALSAINVEAAHFNEHVSQMSLSSALRDIDRRAKTDDPWWAEFDSESDSDTTTDKLILITKPTGGHMLGAIIAVMKAPITTAIACIGVMLSGMGKYANDNDV